MYKKPSLILYSLQRLIFIRKKKICLLLLLFICVDVCAHSLPFQQHKRSSERHSWTHSTPLQQYRIMSEQQKVPRLIAFDCGVEVGFDSIYKVI